MKLLAIALSLLFVGCGGFGNVDTSGIMPDGEKFSVSSKSDALIEVERNGTKIKIDNRGNPSVVEQVLGVGAAAVTRPEAK